MIEAKICPKCGLPQQWEMWQYCSCGYDFGPGSRAIPIRPKSEQQGGPDAEWLTTERIKGFLRGAFIAAWVVGLLTFWIPSLRWLAQTAGMILWCFLWIPTSLVRNKR
jgi:hypothetical protein